MHHQAALDRLLERTRGDPDVLAVFVFGSAARDEQTPASDLDVCLVLRPGRDTKSHSETRLQYLSMTDLDVQVFQDLPLPIRHRILREGRLLDVRDEDALYELAYRTAQAFEDFRHLYRDYLSEVARG